MMQLFRKRKILISTLCVSLAAGLCTAGAEKESKVKAAEGYGVSNPVISGGVSTWDCVYFGSYFQDDTNGDGIANERDEKTPVKWRVLSVDGDDAFLLSDKSLDCKKFNEEKEVTWEECSLRAWMNADFYNMAFDEKEKSAIKETLVKSDTNPKYDIEGGNDTTDKVFLLSLSEVSNMAYGFESVYSTRSKTREAKNTKYAVTQGAFNVEDTEDNKEFIGNGQWWLRTPGSSNTYKAGVAYHGFCTADGLNVAHVLTGVRPALHISLSSSAWENAGKINSYGDEMTAEGQLVATATPQPSASPEPGQPSVPEVKGFKVTSPKKDTVQCQWTVNKSVKKSEVQLSKTKKFSNAKTLQVDMKKGKCQENVGSWSVCYARARAYMTEGNKTYYGAWTDAKKVSVAEIDPINDVKGFQAMTKKENGNNKIIYKWKKDKKVQKCEVYLSKGSDVWNKIVDMKLCTFKFKDAPKGTYYAKMRNLVIVKGKTYYGKWTKVKTVTVK